MATELTPTPKKDDRCDEAEVVRDVATRIRKSNPSPDHVSNQEYPNFGGKWPTTFTKGLPHDEFGLVEPSKLEPFVEFINQPDRTDFSYSDPVGANVAPGPHGPFNQPTNPDGKAYTWRGWESPLAGHVYDLEGPDADALTMPKAPKLGSGELDAEMAEVYALALLRDESFARIGSLDGEAAGGAKDAMDALKGISWFTEDTADKYENARRKARLESDGSFTSRVAFRGSTPGAKTGPYLSQFMLIGNAGRGDGSRGRQEVASRDGDGPSMTVEPVQSETKSPTAQVFRGMLAIDEDGFVVRKANDGYILYGAQEINQRVSAHSDGVDYLTNWNDWIDVQNGKNTKNEEMYRPGGRFIQTPRDLATYVHFDQLYQAYLNACLLMLGYGYPHDRGFPEGGHKDGVRDAFATFGGPHVLSLVTEVATRALKFARRQKFNVHLRARPEAVAGVLTVAAGSANAKAALGADALALAEQMTTGDLKAMLDLIEARNDATGKADLPHNYLLPMAFGEGSPMHPSYGAGHATVAGACVTILKAFFNMYEDEDPLHVDAPWTPSPFENLYGKPGEREDAFRDGIFTTGLFEPAADARSLRQLETNEVDGPITMIGELDKLAANISIGRDMAGVHYYTDYYESLRLGERVAVGIVQEQMLCYPEPVQMRLTSFDGEQILIDGKGKGGAGGSTDSTVFIGTPDGAGGFTSTNFGQWWSRGL